MLKESQWLDVTEKSELDKYVREEDDEDGDMDFIPGDDMDVDEENFNPEYHAGMYHFGTIQSKDFTVYRTDKTLGFK